MAQEKKGLFQRWGESLKKKRSWILYGTAVVTLFLTAACWTMLPAQVVMQAAAVGQAVNAVAKETAILANLGLTGCLLCCLRGGPGKWSILWRCAWRSCSSSPCCWSI